MSSEKNISYLVGKICFSKAFVHVFNLVKEKRLFNENTLNVKDNLGNASLNQVVFALTGHYIYDSGIK